MPRPAPTGAARPPKARRRPAPGSRRDRLAVLLAIATVACVGTVFFLARDAQLLQLLMPGPLASAHGAIEACSACHTRSGSGKLSWINGLVVGDPVADSKACLACHRMPDTAFNAHGASADVLEESTRRLTKIAADTRAPPSARAQGAAFPTRHMLARGLYCATCHQEHQGASFNLRKMSAAQCQACHVAKFDSFDGHHPPFAGYPFKRRTRIVYDHAGHFGKHFPEVAKTDPAKPVPATCSTCHDSRKDRRVMAVAPFDRTCAACHLDQITGKTRVSGPKGIAFLTLPGLDLQTLKKRNAAIGEWPADSEAELTPFMKVMIGRSERGRALIEAVEGLSLQDLSDASDDQIGAVAALVWEIKRLFHALISGKASDVLGGLDIGGGRLSAKLVADLTASIPRDVVVSAQQQWLPSLGTEMAGRRDAGDPERSGWATTIAGSASTSDRGAAGGAKLGGPARPKQRMPTGSAPAAAPAAPLKAAAAEPQGASRKADAASAKPEQDGPSAAEPPQARAADQTDDLLNPTEEELRGGVAPVKAAETAAKAAVAAGNVAAASPKPAQATPEADGQPKAKPADQTDDLLNPTEEELRGIAAPNRDAEPAARPEGAAGKAVAAPAKARSAPAAAAAPKAGADRPAVAPPHADAAAARPQPKAVPAAGIDSAVDPESWAEYGGWYRQDYAISYRPTGHKDKFISAWLVLTGPRAPKGARSPAAAAFEFLIGKDAPGSCTKCHSVDDVQGKGRVANFSPPSVESKAGRFTHFIHEPHFGVVGERGCLACHDLAKGRPYLQSYEQGNPQKFVSGFGAVKKELCQTCHTGGMARQDCLLCHKYHVNGVAPSTMSTRIPAD